MFGTICDEIEVNATAGAAWEVYGSLKLAELVEKGLPGVIDKIEVVEGDGSAGTILKLVFAPSALGFSYYKEKFTKVDDETRVKVTEAVEGGYLDVGFNLYRVRFEIIEKDEKSCITKATIEYDIKEDYAANASLVSIEPLKAIMKIVANYLTNN